MRLFFLVTHKYCRMNGTELWSLLRTVKKFRLPFCLIGWSVSLWVTRKYCSWDGTEFRLLVATCRFIPHSIFFFDSSFWWHTHTVSNPEFLSAHVSSSTLHFLNFWLHTHAVSGMAHRNSTSCQQKKWTTKETKEISFWQNEMCTKRNVDKKKCGWKKMWTNVDLLSPRDRPFCPHFFLLLTAHNGTQILAMWLRWVLTSCEPMKRFFANLILFCVLFFATCTYCLWRGAGFWLLSKKKICNFFFPIFFWPHEFFWVLKNDFFVMNNFWLLVSTCKFFTYCKKMWILEMWFFGLKYGFLDWRWGSLNHMQGSFDRV